MVLLKTTAVCGLGALLSAVLISQLAAQNRADQLTNLQVFPKDISRQELISTMRNFSFSLGVRCVYCHVGEDSPGKTNFASDAKEAKKTARNMIRMVEQINKTYLAGSQKAPVTIDCETCHRGLPRPRTLQAVLLETLDHDGLPAALDRYRQLRTNNYGDGKYDFTEESLNRLSESLLHNNRAKEASAVMELNAEFNGPLSKWGYSCLAMAHDANKEDQKAEGDFAKILELDPHDTWAADRLKSLRAARQAR